MVLVAEAFAGWLVGLLADAGRRGLGRWLVGSEQTRALRQAATAAIQATAEAFRPEPAIEDDPEGPQHLTRVLDHVFQHELTPAESLAGHATLLQGLEHQYLEIFHNRQRRHSSLGMLTPI
jgi:hypothetical protein